MKSWFELSVLGLLLFITGCGSSSAQQAQETITAQKDYKKTIIQLKLGANDRSFGPLLPHIKESLTPLEIKEKGIFQYLVIYEKEDGTNSLVLLTEHSPPKEVLRIDGIIFKK